MSASIWRLLPDDVGFAAAEPAAPLTVSEFAAASRSYPLLFAAGQTSPVALTQESVLANAKAGKAAPARLKDITVQALNEVNKDRGAIDNDAKALQAQRPSIKLADFQQKQQALTQRFQALRQKAALCSREIDATRRKALARISLVAQPIIVRAYKGRNCGLVLDRKSVLGGNFANDLTAAVVQGLNVKLTTISFERENLTLKMVAKK